MIVLVVGAGKTGNIGYGIGERFYTEGHDVVLADLAFEHNEGEQFICDVTDKSSVESLMAEIKVRYGQLDVVINSAGINILGKIEDYALEDFNKTIAVNLTSNFLLLQAYVNTFDNDGNRKAFVAITSDTGMIPKTSTFAYGASKAGANHFVNCTARELNKYHSDNWLVTALAIGRVLTPMDTKTKTDLCAQRGISMDKAEEMLSGNIPLGRGMTIYEVADWTYFVATQGDYATGCVLRIDAGQCQG